MVEPLSVERVSPSRLAWKPIWLITSIFVTAHAGWLNHSVAAIEPKTVKTGAEQRKKTPNQTAPRVDRALEKQALGMVEQHLPELRGMLARLKADEPQEYDRAIRDLSRSAKRLDAAKKRDERGFDVEVEVLKAQNEVNLLTARLKVRDSDKDRKRIRTAVARLHAAQLAKSQYDVDLLQKRLTRAEQLLDAAKERLRIKQESSDAQLDKSVQALLRRAGREPNKREKRKTVPDTQPARPDTQPGRPDTQPARAADDSPS